MRRIRHIVLLSRALPHHDIGGMQAIAWDLARSFASEGYKVSVITSEILGRPPTFMDSGVEIHAIPGAQWRRSRRDWWAATRRVIRDKLSLECAAILSVSAAGFGLLKMRQVFPRVPYVMQAHGTSIGELLSKWRAPSAKSIASSVRNMVWLLKDVMAYPKFDAIVGVGPRIADDLRGFPYKHLARISSLRTIPNGIDTSLFLPDERTRRQERAALQIDSAVRVVVSVSRLHKQKGIDLSLEAVAKLMDGNADVRYLIAGDGPERASLEMHAASLEIAHKVTFVGALTRERLAALLCACDVMLFTSTRIEGLPLNVLEALACGIPAVLSDHLYDEGIFGPTVVPVPPTDTSKVAAGLARALRFELSPGSRLPRGFSLQECARAYLELFEELAARLA